MIDADFTAWLEEFNSKLEFIDQAIELSKRSISRIDIDTTAPCEEQTDRLNELENAVSILERNLARRDALIVELDAKRKEVRSALRKAQARLVAEEVDHDN